MALTDPSSKLETADLTPRSRWDGARMTLDEFLALPEEKPRLEYADGVVTQKVAPQFDHTSLQTDILSRFNRLGQELQHGIARPETRIVTPGWSPVPAVSYYRKERVKPESPRRFGKIEIPPDIAVEIISPDQSVGELLKKCLRYAEIGVAVSLVIDADDETVYAMRPGQPLQVLRGDDRIDLDDVLPGFDLAVHALFGSIVPDWLVGETTPEG
jgi:Uma2 family endonuclease